MKTLFEINKVDKKFYAERIKDFLPDNIIDIHTHVWLNKFRKETLAAQSRTVTWPALVAKDNSIEDLMETYNLVFSDKMVTPLIFSALKPGDDMDAANGYIRECSIKYSIPSLIFARPQWGANELEQKLKDGGFVGVKPYLTFAKNYIPAVEIRIFDFLPPHQLEVLDRLGSIAMLHIPRHGRLRDPVNLAQMLEIEELYPNIKLIIAHVGRAYCSEDIGDAFDVLSKTKKMMFDFSANTNIRVFEQLIKAVGPKRIMFGSDMPITRMRMRRICEDGIYVNLIPKGLYGDVSGDKNMRELEGGEAANLSLFIYEQIEAFRKAALTAKLTKHDIEDIFYNNAFRVIETSDNNLGGH